MAPCPCVLPAHPPLYALTTTLFEPSQPTPHLPHLPPCLPSNDFRRPLPDPQNRQHGIHARHFRKNPRIRNPHPLQPSNPQLTIHNRHLIPLQIPHLRRARGVIHRMRRPAPVLAQLFIRIQTGPGRNLALEPRLERLLLRDLARGAQARYYRPGIVALGVGEVLEVQRGLDGRVCAGQIHLPP